MLDNAERKQLIGLFDMKIREEKRNSIENQDSDAKFCGYDKGCQGSILMFGHNLHFLFVGHFSSRSSEEAIDGCGPIQRRQLYGKT